MTFGMKNAPAMFQRMINQLLGGVKGYEAYIDDVVVYSYVWLGGTPSSCERNTD